MDASPATIAATPQPDVPASREVAECAGLTYVSDSEPGIRRRKAGRGFSYRGPDGRTVGDADTLKRIRSLAVPPAYTDVWICPDHAGHVQATGRDAKGRKQYRYHPRWREVRDGTKYGHMLSFAEALPTLRARVAEDMRRRGLPRDKVLATIVHLLETTLIRIGNEDYAKENKSYGLTTLRNRHVAIEGSALRFQFKGKSGKTWQVQLRDRRVAKVLRACQDLPGQALFQYLDEGGKREAVQSGDVNAYLRAVTGRDITAKDFRTWAGTVLAVLALKEAETPESAAAAKRALRAAIEHVAIRLGNTPAICRKCYIHPEVVACYLDGELSQAFSQGLAASVGVAIGGAAPGLEPEEAAVLNLLRSRLETSAT